MYRLAPFGTLRCILDLADEGGLCGAGADQLQYGAAGAQRRTAAHRAGRSGQAAKRTLGNSQRGLQNEQLRAAAADAANLDVFLDDAARLCRVLLRYGRQRDPCPQPGRVGTRQKSALQRPDGRAVRDGQNRGGRTRNRRYRCRAGANRRCSKSSNSREQHLEPAAGTDRGGRCRAAARLRGDLL